MQADIQASEQVRSGQVRKIGTAVADIQASEQVWCGKVRKIYTTVADIQASEQVRCGQFRKIHKAVAYIQVPYAEQVRCGQVRKYYTDVAHPSLRASHNKSGLVKSKTYILLLQTYKYKSMHFREIFIKMTALLLKEAKAVSQFSNNSVQQ